LAVGEKMEASGKEMLLAYILGVEVECKLGLAINKTPNPFSVRLRVKLKDGRMLEVNGDRSPGITSWDELTAKYKDCLGGVLLPGQIDRSFQMIQELEKVKNISEVVKTLVIPE